MGGGGAGALCAGFAEPPLVADVAAELEFPESDAGEEELFELAGFVAFGDDFPHPAIARKITQARD